MDIKQEIVVVIKKENLNVRLKRSKKVEGKASSIAKLTGNSLLINKKFHSTSDEWNEKLFILFIYVHDLKNV